MQIFCSHSVGCAGWDMESIFKETEFQTGCRTMRFKDADIGKVKMLDWDYLEHKKKPDKVKEHHLELVKEHDFDVVMSMDIWNHNIEECFKYTDTLLKYSDRVLIPVHYYTDRLKNYELAYPNANWFTNNKTIPREYKDNFTHVLGGSPQTQYKLKDDFKNLKSVDGNQIFNVAIRAGKVWYPEKPYWRKPIEFTLTEEIFRKSVKNLNDLWNKPIKLPLEIGTLK